MMDKSAVASSFSAAAHTYDQAAFIEQEIGLRLMQRLEYIKLEPRYILDLGCGTGYFTRQLQNRYPSAIIIGLDIAFGMAKFASDNTQLQYCCGDAEQLPFLDMQFDLIFSNCCLPSIENFEAVFNEFNRVLNLDGLLLVTTFGPDTLQELGIESNWQDMHQIGDILLQQQFKNPVVDTEKLIFKYKKLQTLLTDLQATGSFEIDFSNAAKLELPCEVSYEIINCHAQKQAIIKKQYTDKLGNTYIPVTKLAIL
jgi:malonyl-CoA O-methyltransferase